MRPWRSWNDSTPQSCSLPKGGRNASLIVRRRTAALAISAGLSTHLPEVCLDVRKNMSLPIENSLCPTFHEAPEPSSSVCDLQHPCTADLSHPKKPHRKYIAANSPRQRLTPNGSIESAPDSAFAPIYLHRTKHFR